MFRLKESVQRVCTLIAASANMSALRKKFLARSVSAQNNIMGVEQNCLLADIEGSAKGTEQPNAFLFRVAKNAALTKLMNRSKQITQYIEDSLSAPLPQKETKYIDAEKCLGLYCEAVAGLSGKCREVFLLRKVHGLSHAEIARQMSLTMDSVDKYLCRGILECQNFLRKREAGETNQYSHHRVTRSDKHDL